jgi:hypothetical protein
MNKSSSPCRDVVIRASRDAVQGGDSTARARHSAKRSFQIELPSRRKQTRQQPSASNALCMSARRS